MFYKNEYKIVFSRSMSFGDIRQLKKWYFYLIDIYGMSTMLFMSGVHYALRFLVDLYSKRFRDSGDGQEQMAKFTSFSFTSLAWWGGNIKKESIICLQEGYVFNIVPFFLTLISHEKLERRMKSQTICL